MTSPENDLAVARARRDGALRLLKDDVVRVRADLHARGVGGRIADRIGDGALDMAEEALDYAEDNKGKVAAAITAAVLWFARGPILGALVGAFTPEPQPEPERLTNRLRAINPFSRE